MQLRHIMSDMCTCVLLVRNRTSTGFQTCMCCDFVERSKDWRDNSGIIPQGWWEFIKCLLELPFNPRTCLKLVLHVTDHS